MRFSARLKLGVWAQSVLWRFLSPWMCCHGHRRSILGVKLPSGMHLVTRYVCHYGSLLPRSGANPLYFTRSFLVLSLGSSLLKEPPLVRPMCCSPCCISGVLSARGQVLDGPPGPHFGPNWVVPPSLRQVVVLGEGGKTKTEHVQD